MGKKIVLALMLVVCFTFVFGACKKSGGGGGSSDPTNITNPPVTYNPRYQIILEAASPAVSNPSQGKSDLFTGAAYVLKMSVLDKDASADAGGTYDYSNFVWTVNGSGITLYAVKGNNITVTVEAGASGTVTVTNADAMPYTFTVKPVTTYNPRYQIKLGVAGPMPSNQYAEKSDLSTNTTYDFTMYISDLNNSGLDAEGTYDYSNFVWTVSGSGITVSPAKGKRVTVTVAAISSGTVTVTNADAMPYTFTVK